MSKHTPGPWHVQKSEDCMGRKLDEMVRWVVTADGHGLWISTGPTWDSEHDEESEANALLIAAAPDLLAALVALTTNQHIDLEDQVYAVREAEGLGWDGPSVVSWGHAIRSARDAIAKATGA